MFVDEASAKEIGTSRASMNRTGKTRAQGVKKKFNECKDFHQNEITAHILASFMEMHNIKSLEGMLGINIIDICNLFHSKILHVHYIYPKYKPFK